MENAGDDRQRCFVEAKDNAPKSQRSECGCKVSSDPERSGPDLPHRLSEIEHERFLFSQIPLLYVSTPSILFPDKRAPHHALLYD